MAITLGPGEGKHLSIALTPINGAGELVLERFFIMNYPWQFGPEWDAWCWIKNVGGAPASGQLRWEGQVHYNTEQQVYELDRRVDFTIQPGETFKDRWMRSTLAPLDPAWCRCYVDNQPIMPEFHWLPGYYSYPEGTLVEVEATHVGADWAILRYCQQSECNCWEVSATHPPPVEGNALHRVSYPTLVEDKSCCTLEHLVTGLWSQSRYNGRIYGYASGGAHRVATDIFTTR